jgi:hypothetical protein
VFGKQMKIIFTAVFFLAFSISSFGQSFGIKAGLNVADLDGISTQSSPQGTSPRISYHVGGFFLFPFSERFKVMPQLIYSEQGTTSSDYTARYNYVNMPIMFNIYASDVFFFQFAPQLGVLTSATVQNGTSSQDVKNLLAATDFSFGLGLGVEYQKVIINTNYNLGFTGIYKASTQASVTNSVIQLSIGYKILEYEIDTRRKRRR